jgi:hypothetical protein
VAKAEAAEKATLSQGVAKAEAAEKAGAERRAAIKDRVAALVAKTGGLPQRIPPPQRPASPTSGRGSDSGASGGGRGGGEDGVVASISPAKKSQKGSFKSISISKATY